MKCIILLLLLFSGCTRTLARTDGVNIDYDSAYIKAHGYDLDTVLKHEMGHVRGLSHCPNRTCVMYHALRPREVKDFCPDCMGKLYKSTSTFLAEAMK